MRRIYTIDAETDPFDGTTDILPFIWDIFDGNTHFTADTVEECHDFITDHPGLYYAHNGGRFDYHLSGFCDPIETGTEILAINGRLVRFRMLGSEFRDSFSILPSPLKDIGGKGEIDYAKMKRAVRKEHMTEIIRYLHTDTEVLHTAIIAFHDQYGTGLTLAGTAIKELEKRLPKGKQMPKLGAANDKTMRDFYYGGRVEAFTKGIINESFHIYDIASAYPTAMCALHAWGQGMDVDSNVRVTEKIDCNAFYDVRARSDGCLPTRDAKGALYFPCTGKGTQDFRCSGWELLAGVETGAVDVVKINRKITFSETCSFKAYVDHFYRLKADSPKDSHERLFAKLLLNSAYGKLGANPDHYTRQMVVDEQTLPVYIGADGLGWELYGGIGGKNIIQRPLEDFEKRRLHVGAAASVTGWVRAFLWRSIVDVRRKHGTVLYCDTDSLAVRGARLTTGDRLGDWTLDAVAKSGAIGGKKLYAWELAEPVKSKDGTVKKWKTSSKGGKLTAAQIVAVAKGGKVKWKSEAITFSLTRDPVVMERTFKRT